MNLGGLVTETAPALNILEECDPGALQPWTRLTELPEYADFPAHRLPVANGCREKRRKAIVIHDSFGLFLRPYLSQHFAAVIYVNTMNFEDARPLIERERPDVVMDLRVARGINRSVLPDPELEQRLLPGKFAASGPAAVRIDQSNWQDFLYKSRKTAIRETARGVELSFAGPGASVHLQLNNGRQLATPLLVRIQGTSKQRHTMSLCSHLRGSRGELQRQESAVRNGRCRKGPTRFFFASTTRNPRKSWNWLRTAPAPFTLHSLLRGLEPEISLSPAAGARPLSQPEKPKRYDFEQTRQPASRNGGPPPFSPTARQARNPPMKVKLEQKTCSACRGPRPSSARTCTARSTSWPWPGQPGEPSPAHARHLRQPEQRSRRPSSRPACSASTCRTRT